MKKSVTILVVLVVIIGAVAALLAVRPKHSSTSSGMSHMAHMQSSQSASKPSSSAQAQATNKVAIAGFAFSPAAISVRKGTTVTWTNQDSAPHTVTETDQQDGLKSGELGKSQSYSFIFASAGTYHYHCTIHSNMTGTVTVTE